MLVADNTNVYKHRMSRPRRIINPLLAYTLAGVLLFAQWLLAQHGANLEQHSSSHACEWCLTHAPLTGALAPTALIVVHASALAPQPIAHPVFLAGAPLPAYSTRAPPQASSV